MQRNKKVLIGSPINECKEYCLDKWIESISKFDYPADLLLVDNSPTADYLDKVKKTCDKYKLKSYTLAHVDVDPNGPNYHDEKVTSSRRIIRQRVLDGKYDAWFSLDCDIILPSNALSILVNSAKRRAMVRHSYPSRNSDGINEEMGIAFVKRNLLEKINYESGYGPVAPNFSDTNLNCDLWFIVQAGLKNRKSGLVLYDKIKPIKHL